jgi:amidase
MRKEPAISSGLNRRDFLSTSLAVGAALAVPSAAVAESTNYEAPAPFELDEATISSLQRGMKSGKYSARSLTQKYLQRIGDTDKRTINAVLETNPDALAIADELDRELKAKGPRGPLHGIPVLIKDNIDTADKMMTTAGSLALLGSIAPADSGVAQKLRQAGAIILGKTNLSEWANIRSSHSSSGWSGRSGQTRNPYALDRNPCGSSSGTGAAVSGNFCVAGIGSETDGSIVCPSSANGIVGIKPTLGLVSRAGIIPISHSQDTAGPMARTVTDAAILLGVLTGADPRDPITSESQSKGHTDYTQFLDRNGLKKARIGVLRKLFGFSDAVDDLMAASIEAMKHEGAEIIDPIEIDSIGKLDDSELEVLLTELKADLNAYLAKLSPSVKVRTLKDVIEFNERNKEKEMKYFGQDLLLKAEAKGALTGKEYTDALAQNRKLSREQGIDAVMEKHKLDAIIAPTGGPAWLTDLATGDHFSGGSSQLPAMAGYPNINVPAGYSFGLPVGISFFGRAWSEPKLIAITYAFEQATQYRKAPRFLPTVAL